MCVFLSANPGMSNQYIPKFISQKPWYHSGQDKDGSQENREQKEQDLSHQYKDANIRIDHSKPIAGTGVNDEFEKNSENIEIKKVSDWDSKRDRWHGVDIKAWDEVAKNWDSIKRDVNKKNNTLKGPKHALYTGNEDADADNNDYDTDYELELRELGLDKKDISSKLREDPLEKTLRDRQDVPEYILNINSETNGKVKYEKLVDSSKNIKNGNIVNNRDDFVSAQTTEIRKLENFAWEQAEIAEKISQKKALQNRLNGQVEPTENVTDVNLNLAANPTAMALKVKKREEEEKIEREIKRKKLNDIYG